MKTPHNQIAAVISRQVDKAGANPKKLGREIAAYLLNEQRTGELDSILRDVIVKRSEGGITEVAVVSATPLNEELLAKVKSEVKKINPGSNEIILSQRIEPSLIGGIRLEFPNSQLDLTLRSKLNRLRKLITYGKETISA